MMRIQNAYVRYRNRRGRLDGSLVRVRFGSRPIFSLGDWLTLIRYIAHNATQAGSPWIPTASPPAVRKALRELESTHGAWSVQMGHKPHDGWVSRPNREPWTLDPTLEKLRSPGAPQAGSVPNERGPGKPTIPPA